MKKLLLFALTVSSIGATAQTGSSKFVLQNSNTKKTNSAFIKEDTKIYTNGINESKAVTIANKRFRAVPFATDDMGSGTVNSLPTGWTTGATAGSFGFTHRTTAFTSGFNIGTIASATAANGWLGYNSDSIGGVNGNASPFTAWVQKSFNCTGHPSVALIFSTRFRKFSDSCVVKVSNNGGASFTTYSIAETNSLSNNGTTANPQQILLNISPAAANQANVIVRFENTCFVVGGAYNWLLDDVALAELDPIETRINNAGLSQFTATDRFASRTLPLSQVDSLFPFVFYSNLGANATTNVTTDIKIFNGATQIGSTTAVQASLPVNALDSGRYAQAGFLPTTIGTYLTAFNLIQPGDANPANNKDTVNFSVTDSIYSLNDGLIAGSYILHSKAAGATVARSFAIGNLFTVANTDTITACTVAYSTTTEVGAKVKAAVYKFDTTASLWELVINSNIKTLTATDISVTGGIVRSTITFPFINIGSGLLNILPTGQYAVVVEAHEPLATAKNAFIYSSEELNTIDQFGVGDTMNGDFGFGTQGLPFTVPNTPLVNAIFGHANLDWPTSVNNLSNNFQVNASPNPSNGLITFSINSKESTSNSVINITNNLGQIVKSIKIGNLNANLEHKTMINLTDLPAGSYLFTLQGGKNTYTNKFVIN